MSKIPLLVIVLWVANGGCISAVSTQPDKVEFVTLDFYKASRKASSDVFLEMADTIYVHSSDVYVGLSFTFASEQARRDLNAKGKGPWNLDSILIKSFRVFLSKKVDPSFKRDITTKLTCPNPNFRFFRQSEQMGYCSDIPGLKNLYNECAKGLADFHFSTFKNWIFKINELGTDLKGNLTYDIRVEIEFQNGRRLSAKRSFFLLNKT